MSPQTTDTQEQANQDPTPPVVEKPIEETMGIVLYYTHSPQLLSSKTHKKLNYI